MFLYGSLSQHFPIPFVDRNRVLKTDAMFLNSEIEKLIYKDLTHTAEKDDWVDHFYDLWLERYHAMDIVRSASDVIKLNRGVLLKLLNDYKFDELHLFKIYENANVFALLTDVGNNYWSYEFFIIHKDNQDDIIGHLKDVEEIKDHFDHVEPVLEIPLPHDRKYKD
jgi:predicted protein tyrosine phosphatase